MRHDGSASGYLVARRGVRAAMIAMSSVPCLVGIIFLLCGISPVANTASFEAVGRHTGPDDIEKYWLKIKDSDKQHVGVVHLETRSPRRETVRSATYPPRP
jgi:hypothetical protein